MSNIRLYFPDNIVKNTTSLLSKEHTHYVASVMRLKRGSNLNFFNKDGEWLSEIIFLDRDRLEVKFLNKIKEPINSSNIELAICLVKKSPMENILQKATELGVSKIVPIVSERTEVKEMNFERANKIIVEAIEQSNQLMPPQISGVTKLTGYLKNFDSSSKLLFADVNSKYKLKPEDIKQGQSISILIGPEGDFSPQERELILATSSLTSFTLSKNILRTDTAVISAISLVNFIQNEH
jgi:16S rRNA (uracil1498-N3)-methyltransferase